MLYAAIAATIFATFKVSQTWGSTAALGFAAFNGLVIWLLPAGKLLGLVIAGLVLYLLREPQAPPPSRPA